MSVTDLIAIVLTIFLLTRGAFRGFLGSLLGPVALILASLISFIYYNFTQNILISLCIGLSGPFVLGWLLRAFLHSWTMMTNSQGKISLPSRIAGALLTWGWGMAMMIITVLLLAMLPPFNKTAEFVYKDIHLSRLYSSIKFLDTSAIDKPTTETEIKSLAQDQRIQDIVNDSSIVDSINRKDYSAIISNPKITAIMKDPALMKKMMVLYRQMMQEKMNSQ